MSEATTAVHGDVAVILIDNPPVNGLGHAQRERMAAELDRAWADPAVRAIVVAGAGKLFCGGADIKAFNTPASRAEPSSRTLVKRIECSAKPVIAAIHGNALGLGLEFAMGCHYRIAAPGCREGHAPQTAGLRDGAASLGVGGDRMLPEHDPGPDLTGKDKAQFVVLNDHDAGAKAQRIALSNAEITARMEGWLTEKSQ